MISKRWYRWLKVFFGAKSFTKNLKNDQIIYVLVSRGSARKLTGKLLDDGFKEEFTTDGAH